MGIESSTQYSQFERELKIVVVGPKSGENAYSESSYLPKCARIISTGNTYAELIEKGCDITQGNAILNLTGNKLTLPSIINQMPQLVWFHSLWAGMDNILCPELVSNNNITVTNAKGVFSSSLAEYVLSMCLFFAKDIPRLMHQKQQKIWDKYHVSEIKGKVMGIIGYGDIGRSCAKVAKACGMKVLGVRRRVELSADDEYVDRVCMYIYCVCSGIS